MTSNQDTEISFRTKTIALGRVLLVTVGAYLTVKAVSYGLGNIAFFDGILSGLRQQIAAGFTRSLLAYMGYLAFLIYVIRSKTIADAIRSLRQPAPRDAWFIAGIAAAIQTVVLLGLFISNPERVFEASFFNVYTSLVTAIGGGLGEETIYRAFVIITLANAGFTRTTQVLLSGALFGASHMSWSLAASDLGLLQILSPVLGTFGLGCVFAIAFQVSKHRLLPVVVAHGLINLIVEPWLAVSYYS